MSFRPDIEFQDQPVIRRFQEEKLHQTLRYLADRSPYYRELFRREKININSIKTLDDLSLIPVTEKRDLQMHNNEFLCVDKSRVADYMTTSGTLGNPVTVFLTSADLDRLAYNEAVSFTCAGGSAGQVYQLMTTIDKRFMAGLAYYLGIRMMGGSIARVGNGNPELQWDTIRRISPESIICVPSFILKIISYAEQKGIDYRSSSIKRAICIGENLREQDFSLNLLGKKIKEKWDIELYSTYASTEMATTFTECEHGCGGHHHPELIITELLDKDDNPVADGEFGELTITTLGVEAMPLLRFKTGDIARFHNEPCSCGRKTMRISPILGRRNQMIKYKGTTLYPASVFDVLNHAEYVENYIVEVGTNDCGTDDLIVTIGCRNPSETIIKELKDSFRAKLRVAPEIMFLPVEQITAIQNPELNRKPLKFFDNRKPDHHEQ